MSTVKAIKNRMEQPKTELFWHTCDRVVRYRGNIESLNTTTNGNFVKLSGIDRPIDIAVIFLNAKEACNSWVAFLKKEKANNKPVSLEKMQDAFENFKI